MHDEWQRNRNLEVADSYPFTINHLEVAKALKIKESLFEDYPNDYTITYTYLVTVDEQGRQIEASFEGGDNMAIKEDTNLNIKLLKFEPGKRNGSAIKSNTIVSYMFTLLKQK
jgi:hypothetical protein